MGSRASTLCAKSLKQAWRNPIIWKDPLAECLAPRFSRSMATETRLPREGAFQSFANGHLTFPADEGVRGSAPVAASVLTTIYKFPTMEPMRFEHYPANHLNLPLRRDILHRAVVYEGDFTRQGTASTKWRGDVHGSNRKLYRQKGTGRARRGDKKSPILRGGGVAFGPHPRDFSTKLPRKMYDLAWRTALSYRYKKGELVVVEDGMEIDYPKTRLIKQVFETNQWGNPNGRSLLVATSFRENLFQALKEAGEDGRVLTEDDVDVKDLLEMGRIIVEKSALDGILRDHQSDLAKRVPTAVHY